MSRWVSVPRDLTHAPFVGRDAVSAGLISRAQLAGETWRRMFPDVYAWADLPLDHRAESPQETRLRLLLLAGGLPRPVTQYEVRDANGLFVARLDLAYPKVKLGIEYEGDHHRGRGVFQRDLRRVNALRACGWTVLRFAAADIYRDPAKTVALVRAALSG